MIGSNKDTMKPWVDTEWVADFFRCTSAQLKIGIFLGKKFHIFSQNYPDFLNFSHFFPSIYQKRLSTHSEIFSHTLGKFYPETGLFFPLQENPKKTMMFIFPNFLIISQIFKR